MGNQVAKQKLYRAIAKRDRKTIQTIVQQYPQLINSQLTKDSLMTPILKAINSKNIQILEYLVTKGADVNFPNSKGITPLMMCSITRNIDIALFLIQHYQINQSLQSQDQMTALDYAIFYAVYDIAILLKNRKKVQIKTPQFYQNLQRKYKTKYVNYPVFVLHVEKNFPFQAFPDYLTPVKPVPKDLVVDPRQNWSQMITRIANFTQPPMIERSQLPEDLKPQNRNILSRIRTRIQVGHSEIVPKNGMKSKSMILKKRHQQDTTQSQLKQNQLPLRNRIDNNQL